MTECAHIRSGALIAELPSEEGWITLENGDGHSPPKIGFQRGNDKVVALERETQDNSTGPDTVTEVTKIVEANRLHVLTVIRDLTAQELEDRKDEIVNQVDDTKDLMRALAQTLLDGLNLHATRVNEIKLAIETGGTLTQIKAQVASINEIPTFTFQQLKAQVRAKLGT